jgi:hypothetical protein
MFHPLLHVDFAQLFKNKEVRPVGPPLVAHLTMIPTRQLGIPGAQKTTHPGKLTMNVTGENTACFWKSSGSQSVAVKRLYYKLAGSKNIERYPAKKEISTLMLEANSLHWAIPLMKLVYGFISRFFPNLNRDLDLEIPQVHMTISTIFILF